jgi:hypothetical protein
LTPAICRAREVTGVDDGKSCGIRFSNGSTRDPRHLTQYGKAKLVIGALSPRYGLQRIGTVSTHANFTTPTLTHHTVVSFGFYHFACIMLLTYKPGPKFAIRNTASLSDTNVSILDAHYNFTDLDSKQFWTMLESYVVPASALQRQSLSLSRSATQFLSGDRLC